MAVSVDDFYLTRAEQVALAQANPENPYWQQRGYPGTHDVKLGEWILSELRAGHDVLIPFYDKSAHQGQGDRKPQTEWRRVRGRVEVVFLEGWMLGFQPTEGIRDPFLQQVNSILPAYKAWMDKLDAFIWLEPEDHRFVLNWRVEAEEKMKAAGKPGMSLAEVKAYIEKFLPAYETYLPTLQKGPPVSGPFLHLRIGGDRLPLSLDSSIM